VLYMWIRNVVTNRHSSCFWKYNSYENTFGLCTNCVAVNGDILQKPSVLVMVNEQEECFIKK